MRCNGFSLIELLAVLALIAIILGLTLPSLGPMNRNLKLKTSAERLANTLEAARQYAVTSGENCYVVFPTLAMGNNAYMNYRAFKIYSLQGGTIGQWETFPAGVTIDGNSARSTFLQRNPVGVAFPEDGDSLSSLSQIGFEPDGGPVDLKVGEGDVRLMDSGANNFCYIKVHSYIASIREYTLGETP